MSHYVIVIPVDKEDIEVVKRDLQAYLEKSGGFTVEVKSKKKVDHYDGLALGEVVKKLLVRLLVRLEACEYKPLH